MAITVTERTYSPATYLAQGFAGLANFFVSLVDIQFDASYPTNGEAFDATALAALHEDAATVVGLLGAYKSSDGSNTLHWDPDAELLQVFDASGAEEANATDLSGANGLFQGVWVISTRLS